jgi:hypothetical protein
MRFFVGAAWALALAACASGASDRKQADELRTLEVRLEARIATAVTLSERKINDKIATLVALEQKTAKALEDIEKHAKLLRSANDRIILLLEAQQKAIKEQLVTIEAMLEDLKREGTK